ncbi:MAG: glycoside hydrolase family 19 protein [Chthoniobacteraceae bacterium]
MLIIPSLGGQTPTIATYLNRAIEDAGIKTRLGQAMFIAQVAHESAGFTKLFEDGGHTVYNTKTHARSRYKAWRHAHPGKTAAEPGADEQVYDYFFFMYDKDSPDKGRQKVAMNLGNVNAGDGKLFRGRGYIQLTGRNNYRAAGKALELDLENNPDLAAQPANAARIAGWFWKMKGLNKHTKLDTANSFKAVTLGNNGGYNGLSDRTAICGRAKSVLGITATSLVTKLTSPP